MLEKYTFIAIEIPAKPDKCLSCVMMANKKINDLNGGAEHKGTITNVHDFD